MCFRNVLMEKEEIFREITFGAFSRLTRFWNGEFAKFSITSEDAMKLLYLREVCKDSTKFCHFNEISPEKPEKMQQLCKSSVTKAKIECMGIIVNSHECFFRVENSFLFLQRFFTTVKFRMYVEF